MRMRGIFWITAVLLLSPVLVGAGAAFAQDQSAGGDNQPPTAQEIVTMMQSKLNLTADQVAAITPIIEKYSSKREDLRQNMEDGTADRDSMRSQMKQLGEDEKQELSQVLSAEQLSQWNSMRRAMHKQSSENSGNGGGN